MATELHVYELSHDGDWSGWQTLPAYEFRLLDRDLLTNDPAGGALMMRPGGLHEWLVWKAFLLRAVIEMAKCLGGVPPIGLASVWVNETLAQGVVAPVGHGGGPGYSGTACVVSPWELTWIARVQRSVMA